MKEQEDEAARNGDVAEKAEKEEPTCSGEPPPRVRLDQVTMLLLLAQCSQFISWYRLPTNFRDALGMFS